MLPNIFKSDFISPETYTPDSGSFVLIPTDRRFSRLDYEAVMASRKFLREWGGDTWPADDFTENDNFVDLKYHVFDNLNNRAYGYMILNPEKNRALGSVYVNQLGDWSKFNKLIDGADPSKDFQARIDYWVRSDESSLEEKLLPQLKEWFLDIWKIKALIATREAFKERNELIKDLALPKICELESLQNPRKMILHALT